MQQLKFGSYGDAPQASGAIDVPLMRVEEMYLILAEAQGMLTPTTGAKTLSDFVKTYRQPDYSFNGSTPDAVRKEVWRQRRIELWAKDSPIMT